MRPLIIERPDLQTTAQRYGNVSVTVVCWMVWLYLFVPLLSLLAWATGATLVYEVIYMDLGEGVVISRALSYGKGIAVLTGSYCVWAIYNYLRWSGVERRHDQTPVAIEEMADTFHMAVDRIREIRAAKVLTLSGEELAEMFGEQESGLEERLEELDLREAQAA